MQAFEPLAQSLATSYGPKNASRFILCGNPINDEIVERGGADPEQLADILYARFRPVRATVVALIGLMVLTAKLAPVRHQKKEPLLHEAISYGLSAPGGGAVGPMICYIADFVFVKEPALGARLGNRHCYLARLSPVMAQVIGE